MVNACLGHSSVLLSVSVLFWDTVPFPWGFSFVVCMSATVCISLCCDSSVTERVFLLHLAHYNLRSSFLFWLFYWLGNDIRRWGNDAMQILIMGHVDFLFPCFNILSTEEICLIFFAVHTDNLCRIMLFASHMHGAKCSFFQRNALSASLLLFLLLHMANRSLKVSDSDFLTYTN